MARKFWKQARSVRLFTTTRYCQRSPPEVTSEVLHVLTTGQPVPPGGPAPRDVEEAKVEDFALSDVELSQDEEGTRYFITYTVKNLSRRRASGTACLRAYTGEGCDCHVEETASGDFSLPAGGSETIKDQHPLRRREALGRREGAATLREPDGLREHGGCTERRLQDRQAVMGPCATRYPPTWPGSRSSDPDNNDAVVDVPDERPVEEDEPYSDSPEETGH